MHYLSWKVEIRCFDFMLMKHDGPEPEESRAAEAIFPVKVGTAQDPGGRAVTQVVLVLDTLGSRVVGEEVAVKPVLCRVMVVTCAEVGQVSYSCKI